MRTGSAPRTEHTERETAEQAVTEFLARVPRRSPGDLVAMARQQGKSPVVRFEDLLGPDETGEDDFDVDDFLTARDQWRLEEEQLDEQRAAVDDVDR